MSLFADSVDFLEDASINLLILLALAWSAERRARLGMVLAAILLAPALAGLWTAGMKLMEPVAPAAVPLTLTGLGALAVNLTCALMLARVRDHHGSLTRAAFLSARNDAAANIAIIIAGLVTATALALGLAGPDRRHRHRRAERGCRPRDLARRPSRSDRQQGRERLYYRPRGLPR